MDPGCGGRASASRRSTGPNPRAGEDAPASVGEPFLETDSRFEPPASLLTFVRKELDRAHQSFKRAKLRPSFIVEPSEFDHIQPTLALRETERCSKPCYASLTRSSDPASKSPPSTLESQCDMSDIVDVSLTSGSTTRCNGPHGLWPAKSSRLTRRPTAWAPKAQGRCEGESHKRLFTTNFN